MAEDCPPSGELFESGNDDDTLSGSCGAEASDAGALDVDPGRGWNVAYMQQVASRPDGLRLIEKHIRNTVVCVDNSGKQKIVLKTCNDGHDHIAILDASKALTGMKLHKLEVARDASEVNALETEVRRLEVDIQELEDDDDDSREDRRELKSKKSELRRTKAKLTAARCALEEYPTQTTTIKDVVTGMLPKITKAHLVFQPSLRDETSDFNLFQGYAVETFLDTYPHRYPDAVKPVLDHIRVVLCADDVDVYEFVLKWIAHVRQRPAAKSEVALLFYSKPGTGKSIFLISSRPSSARGTPPPLTRMRW